MSKELDLTVQDAQAMLDTISLKPEDWKQYSQRSDAEKLALGVFILSLTMKGMSLRKIEEQTGIPRMTVSRYRDRALQAIALPTVDEARKLELERLEALVEAVWPLAITGDPAAISSYMKLSVRMGEITGTNKPTQVESVVLDITPQEQALQQLFAEAQKQQQLEELEILEEEDGTE